MTERVLGEQGSRRRRRFLLLPLLVTAALALFWIAGAQAVHDDGVFQLDGNAQAAVDWPSPPGPAANDDWDEVCKQVTITNDLLDGVNNIPDECASVATGLTGADAVSWTSEPDRSASIFTGGGSKDPSDISEWAWKNEGGLPDKDNLLHAFAARYTESGTEDFLYFGSDRDDNSGDATQGFWFLQNACSLGTNKIGGGTGFACVGDPTPGTPADAFHRVGDVLVLSDFSNGGDKAIINIYRWVASGGDTTTHLDFLAGGEGAAAVKCDPALDEDENCGIVNPTNGTIAPWSYTDKSGNSTYLQGEFFEAGINLAPLGLAGECFATLVAETRSATSPTAQLKDFVISPFAPCSATMTTLPTKSDNTTATSVSPGTPVHDVATVVGSNAAQTPSGTVTFFLCSFAVGNTTDSCDKSDAGTGLGGHTGVSIGTGLLSGSGATATASSPNVNGPTGSPPSGPLAPGRYCFRAEWPGDSNYIGAKEFDGLVECFNVTVIATEIKTAQFFYPNDTATIRTADGSNLPAGTATFKLYGPTTSPVATAQANCTANTSQGLLYSTVQAIAGGAASESASTANATVAVPTNTTSLYWRVTYAISPANSAYSPVSSVCVENSVYVAGAGGASTINITDDPTFHN